MIYNLAETYFIGKTDDPYKVAAASVTYMLFIVANSLSNLFGIGGGSLISRLLGKQQPDEAKKVCAISLFGALILSLSYSACCRTKPFCLTPGYTKSGHCHFLTLPF